MVTSTAVEVPLVMRTCSYKRDVAIQWRIEGTHAPQGPNSFNFMQFLGKFGKIVCWCPPGELTPPPRGNPGSATAIVRIHPYPALRNPIH